MKREVKNRVVLENSTNTHVMDKVGMEVTELEGGVLIDNAQGGLVTHGEHATIKTETKTVLKINQQEYNPLTEEIQNAVD